MADAIFRARTALRPSLEGLPASPEAGVFVAERDGLGLASVFVRPGKAEEMTVRLRKLYGIEPPDGPRIVRAPPLAFVGTTPGGWLALHDNRPNDFALELAEDLGGIASVADQSDGYALLRLAGPRVRDALAKGVTIDLHPRSFGPGAAAVTSAAHIGIILWRPDIAGRDDVFDVALFRSYADSFWHWLSHSAAEFGLAALPSLAVD